MIKYHDCYFQQLFMKLEVQDALTEETFTIHRPLPPETQQLPLTAFRGKVDEQ